VSGNIIVLPREVREKIRAGEVIENPSSVVKELIENSIDAQGTRIMCEVEAGGLAKIRVIDNGIGMSPQNVERSLMRYATSKIKDIDDISSIHTFGFRGEALPSIKSVSELIIESKSADEEVGFLVRAEGERIVEKRPQPRKKGTTVEVRRLFFNTPARRKFMKSESVEFRRIREVFNALALRNRDIHFTLFHNGSLKFDAPPTHTLKMRVEQILGNNSISELMDFSDSYGRTKVEGVISKPANAKSRRDFQFIFVNRRWIKSSLVGKAIYKGYGETLWGKHPRFAIELSVPQSEIDINVHPTKREVLFSKKRDIFESVFLSIKKKISDKKKLPELSKDRGFYPIGASKASGVKEEKLLFSIEDEEKGSYDDSLPKGFWQLHDSYIFASTKTGFMIVDQHAAHERIIFDRIMRRKSPLPPQMLLFPLSIDLSIEEEEFLEESIQNFYELGFRVKKFSGKTVIFEGIPPFLKEIDEELVHDLLQDLMGSGESKDSFKEIAKEVSCKAAIKAGKEMKRAEINQLFDNLFATEEPYTCPHGRPTMIKFTLKELEKKFKRR
jgi:DNA mismatch repair protein MutL